MSIRSVNGEFSLFLIYSSAIKIHLLSMLPALVLPLLGTVAAARSEINERKLLAKRSAMGKRIAEFCEELVTRPPELIEEGVQRGLKKILEVTEAERVSWCEVDERAGELIRLFAVNRDSNAPSLPMIVPTAQIPYVSSALLEERRVVVHDLEELPGAAEKDRQLLEQLGLKSMVIIPSNYPGRKRPGALALTSRTEKSMWTEEFIEPLACVANIIGATLERQITLEASQESDRRFQLLFDQASIGIAIETADGQMLHVNPAFCAMIGYTERELLNSTCERISHPGDEEVERPLFEELR